MKNILNTRLKMALLLHSKESGFAIVIAVSLGLIMLMVGLTMILRSQNDQTVASTQKQTEETVAIAEKGIAYYQSFFNSNGTFRKLTKYPDCTVDRGVGETCSDPATTTNANQWSWSNASNIPGLANTCSWTSSGGQSGILASTAWRDLDNPSNTTTPGIRQFRLVSYKYIPPVDALRDPGLGKLTVEARIVGGPGSNIAKSITRLSVDIPVSDGDIFSIPLPGVWVGSASDTDGTGRSNIDGDVMVSRCFDAANSTDAANLAIMENNIVDPHRARVSDIPLLSMPTAIRNTQARRISTAPDPLNPPTPLPGQSILSNTQFDRPGFIDLGSISSNITLPDNTETRTPLRVADGRYRTDVSGIADVHIYKVSGISGNTTVTIRPGARVAFLLEGNIDRNVSIQCNDTLDPQPQSADSVRNYNTPAMNVPRGTPGRCRPLDIMIFGMNTTGNICINGNRVIEGFVFAPTYTVGVAGGGSVSPGNFVGTVWANQWGGASGVCPTGGTGGSLTHVAQRGGWNDLPTFARGHVTGQLPPRIGSTGTWQRQLAN